MNNSLPYNHPDVRRRLYEEKNFFRMIQDCITATEVCDDEIIKANIRINALQHHSGEIEKRKTDLLSHYKKQFLKSE